jgi:4-alpha-glucanotransferase
MSSRKSMENSIAVLKRKLKKAIDDKNTILREFEDEEKPLLYHYREYKETKHTCNEKGWKAYSKVNYLSTKIKKLSKQLKDIQNEHADCVKFYSQLSTVRIFSIVHGSHFS